VQPDEKPSIRQDTDTMIVADLSAEAWREYDFGGRTYRIENPKTLYMRKGGTTHRVVDADGTVHCAPAPGFCGCILRWINREGFGPVQF
jgi:hypothetical protein